MTAEFAVALPAVLLVLAACLLVLQAGGAQVRAVATAAAVARVQARGDDPSVAAAVLAADPGARVTAASSASGLRCVTVRETAVPPPVPAITATSCALVSAP